MIIIFLQTMNQSTSIPVRELSSNSNSVLSVSISPCSGSSSSECSSASSSSTASSLLLNINTVNSNVNINNPNNVTNINNANNNNGPFTEAEFKEYFSANYQPPRSYFGPEQPFAYIVEQPAKCGVRFRYECEGRISTAIPGISTSATRYTSPTIAIANYQGPVKVVVSCVSKDSPYRPHPHNLVGKKFCIDGISVSIFTETICEFGNLGILCAKRRDIRERLKLREQLKIDPFGTGFGHKLQTFKSIDLSVLRLCFQVYLFDNITGTFSHVLEPIVSDEIHDRKAVNELSIIRLSHDSSPAFGGGNAILLCEKIVKEDIQIRFFQEQCGLVIWQKMAEFASGDVHKHFAISFRIPQYELPLESNQTVCVQVQLYRPSDQAISDPLPFYYFSDIPSLYNPRKESDNGFWNDCSFYENNNHIYSHGHSETVLINDQLSDNIFP